jgi:dipeptidyl aminopeptidase/acylaminoacyl peptidase
VTVGNYACWGSQDALIFRPDKRGTFPLLSFAHGLGNGNEDVHAYDTLMKDLAGSGYIVIANKSAGTLYCTDETKDQIRSIEWATYDETYKDLIDWKNGTGVLGHSMGGQATRWTASN